MRASPALLAFVELLALPIAGLEELVELELADNPALERVEPLGGASGGDSSPAVAYVPSPRERLLAEVALALPAGDRALAEYVIGSLDDRGFLDRDTDTLAQATGVEVERVERVLRAVRDAGPPGIGARGARECLLLQLERFRGDPVAELAQRVLAEHLEELARSRDDMIAAALDVTRGDVERVRTFIRTYLRPDAGLGESAPPPPLVPDVVVLERPDEPGVYDVELREDRSLGVALSPLYERLAHDGCGLSQHERACVQSQVAQARAFLERVRRRRATLRRVAEFVIEYQRPFLREGARALRPLTRAEVANHLGLHESTVGRAVGGRYVRLPSGRIVPCAIFFRPSLGAEEALASLVAGEEHPRSDAELADALAARGFSVARRTVAKYRARLGILPYPLR
jgi:RNA polymerase sigma-54 factor